MSLPVSLAIQEYLLSREFQRRDYSLLGGPAVNLAFTTRRIERRIINLF